MAVSYNIPEMQLDLRETHVIGKRTREQIVSSEQVSELAGQGIELVGISEARRGFFLRVIRLPLP